jgi:hypothetical protein
VIDIKRLIEFLRIDQNALAEAIGKHPSSITKVKQRKMDFPDEWKGLINSKFNINVDDFDDGIPFSYRKNTLEKGEKHPILRGKDANMDINNKFVLPSSDQVKQVAFEDFQEVELLSIEAQAGYLDAIELNETPKLDYMLIPREYEKGNYLVIEVSGSSLDDGSSRSIQDGDKLLCKELIKDHWKNKLHFKQYLFVIVGPEGIVCKQITDHNPETGEIICHSWNPQYSDYTVNLENVYKLFYVKKIVERRIKF